MTSQSEQRAHHSLSGIRVVGDGVRLNGRGWHKITDRGNHLLRNHRLMLNKLDRYSEDSWGLPTVMRVVPVLVNGISIRKPRKQKGNQTEDHRTRQ